MAITKIEVKNGILNMEFTPAVRDNASFQFDGKSNKLMVDTLDDTMPSSIDITYKTVDGQKIFTIRAKESEHAPRGKKGNHQ